MKTIKLKDILAISGKGGLFKFIAQARNGIIVEALDDQKRHVAPASARVSSLEDIAIFTYQEEVPLGDVFHTIFKHSEAGQSLSHKAPAEELKSLFRELLPEYDEDRVYISDIKKVFQWYNSLQKHELLEEVDKEEEDKEEAAESKQDEDSPAADASGQEEEKS